MKKIARLIAVSVLFINFSCSSDLCADYYSSVQVTVQGEKLSDFYTVRAATGEKIRYAKLTDSQLYSVLEEDFRDNLNGGVEEFTFVGFVNDKQVINEKFTIKGGTCHVFKQKGVSHIELQ